MKVVANERRGAASPSRMAAVGTARGNGLLRRAWCFLVVLGGDAMAMAVTARTGEWNGEPMQCSARYKPIHWMK